MSYKIVNIRFSYKHCNFSDGCLLVKMAFKTVTRSVSSILYFCIEMPRRALRASGLKRNVSKKIKGHRYQQ